MSRRSRTRGPRAAAAALAALFGTAGCDRADLPFLPSGEQAAPAAPAPAATPASEGGDVLLSGPAVWDGRFSLGGIWVAHPGVGAPERVRIENLSNGRTVTGALFRRNDQAPGPAMQVSSDAADALGIEPDAPADLLVRSLAAPPPEDIDDNNSESQ